MNKKTKTIIAKVESDHQDIKSDMHKLKIELDKNISADDFASWRLNFLWQMRDFKNRLLKHFDLEEEGGFMRDVIRLAPHSERKVKHLKNEHAHIVLALDNIIARLKSLRFTETECLKSLHDSIDELMLTLRQHEEEEHTLMQRTYYREYGGPA
jgi:hypothetical protein